MCHPYKHVLFLIPRISRFPAIFLHRAYVERLVTHTYIIIAYQYLPSVTTIGKYAFYGCTTLASTVIPDSVTSIGRSAFSGCTSLASIVVNMPLVDAFHLKDGLRLHLKVSLSGSKLGSMIVRFIKRAIDPISRKRRLPNALTPLQQRFWIV